MEKIMKKFGLTILISAGGLALMMIVDYLFNTNFIIGYLVGFISAGMLVGLLAMLCTGDDDNEK
jgi:hypothetical protein